MPTFESNNPYSNLSPEQFGQLVAQQQQQVLTPETVDSSLQSISNTPQGISLPILAAAKHTQLSEADRQSMGEDNYDYIYNKDYFRFKYGPEITNEIDAALEQYAPEFKDTRSLAEKAQDIAVSTGWGLAKGVGELAALATRVSPLESLGQAAFDQSPSLWLHRALNWGSEYVDENLHTDKFREAKDLNTIIDAGREALLDKQDADAKAKNPDRTFMNTLESWGRRIIAGGKNVIENPLGLETATFENLPSVAVSLGTGAAVKGATKAATKLVPQIEKAAAKAMSTTGGKLLRKGITPEMLINGIMEAGGTKSEAIAAIDAMKPEQLRESPQFVALEQSYLDQGLSETGAFVRAQSDFAQQIGDKVAAYAGALGFATGRINPEFSNPDAFSKAFLRGALSRIGNGLLSVPKETAQEFIESGGEALAQNKAMREKGYDVPLMKDVAKNAGAGAITGGMIGGVVPATVTGAKAVQRTAEKFDNFIHRKDFNQKGKELSKVINAKQEQLLSQYESDPVIANVEPELKSLHKQIGDYIQGSKDILIGRNAIEAEGSPFEQNLKAISGREDITDKTADIFDDDKPLVENYTNIVREAEKLAKKGNGTEAIKMLQDAQAMATIINAAAKLGTVAFDSSIKPFLDDIPTVDEKEWKNLPKAKQQAQVLKKYANIAVALTGFNLEQTKAMDKELKLQNEIPNLIKDSPKLEAWFQKYQDEPEKVTSLSEEDQKLFHSINKTMVFYDRDASQPIEKKRHLIKMLEQFVQDKSLAEETREVYRAAIPALKSQIDFLQNTGNDISRIHSTLLSSNKKANDQLEPEERGKDTAIANHVMRLARHFILAKNSPNEQTKAQLKETFNNAYNFLWSESRKYYALNAARATSLDNPQGTSQPVEYNSYGVDKITGKTYWSVQSPVNKAGVSQRKTKYWNNAKSPALATALEYEIGTLKSILNTYVNDINKILGTKEFDEFTYEENLFNTDATGQYDKYAKLAKELPYHGKVQTQPKPVVNPAPQVSGSKPATPQNTPNQVDLEQINKTIERLNPGSSLDDYDAMGATNLQTITYRGSSILNKPSQDKWRETLEGTDFDEAVIIEDEKVNDELDKLYLQLLRRNHERQLQQAQQQAQTPLPAVVAPKKPVSTAQVQSKPTPKPAQQTPKQESTLKATRQLFAYFTQYGVNDKGQFVIQTKNGNEPFFLSFIKTQNKDGTPNFKFNLNNYRNVSFNKALLNKTVNKPHETFNFSHVQWHLLNHLRPIILSKQINGKSIFTTKFGRSLPEKTRSTIVHNFLHEALSTPEFISWFRNIVEITPELSFINKDSIKIKETPQNTPVSPKKPQPDTSIKPEVKPSENSSQSQKPVPLGTKDNPLQIYSDGSDIKGTGNIGYGAVFEHNGKQYVISGTNESEAIKQLQAKFPEAKFSNPTMEMVALTSVLETLANLGIAEHIQINQDYKGAISYDGLWQYSEGDQSGQRPNKPWKAKEPYIQYIVERAKKAILKIEQNGGSVSIRWVKGHVGNKLNEAADIAAKSREIKNTFKDAYQITEENIQPKPQSNPKPETPPKSEDIFDSDKAEQDFVKELLDEFIELNQDKKYNREQSLRVLFMEDYTGYRPKLEKYILDRLHGKNKIETLKDYDWLNNQFYLQSIITDFLDSQENPNLVKTVPTTGYVFHTILPKLAMNLRNGSRIMRELNSKKEENAFKDYFVEQWKVKQQSAENGQPYHNLRGILDDIIQITEQYTGKTKLEDEYSAPEDVQNILSLNSLEPEQITLDDLYKTEPNTFKILTLKTKALKNAFGSLTSDRVFGHKHYLLNYASSPKALIRSLLTKAYTESQKENTDYFDKSYEYNKNAKSTKALFQKIYEKYDKVSQSGSITLSDSIKTLFTGENSLVDRVYAQLEKAYSASNIYSPTNPLSNNSAAMRRSMLNQNQEMITREDGTKVKTGTSRSTSNRVFWLTLDKNGKPILNRHLVEKAIIGSIMTLVQNDTGKLNINRNLDDIDKEFPHMNARVKQLMARTYSADSILRLIRDNIEKYTDISFKDNIDLVTKNYITNALATDILRIFENEGFFLKSHVAMLTKEGDSIYTKFAAYSQKPNESLTDYYARLNKIKDDNQAKGYKTTWYTHFDFRPNNKTFYTGVSSETRNDLESFGLLSSMAPDLIDTLIFPETNSSMLIGEGELPIATNQKHTEEVLTSSQKDSIKKRQEASYYLNKPMFSIAKVLATSTNNKKDSYIDVLLGRTNLSENNEGVMEDIVSSIEGQKIATGNMISNMTGLISRMLAQTNGESIENLPLHFKYDIQRMGRLMIDGYNPQSDKMFREIFLPKAETVDLTDLQTYNVFLRSVAQSFGDKVQYVKSGQDFVNYGKAKNLQEGLEQEKQELENKLLNKDDKLTKFLSSKETKDIVEAYQKLITSDDFQAITNDDAKRGFTDSALSTDQKKIILNFIEALTKYLGSDSSWVALHGMTEYLRYKYYQEHEPEKLKKFTSQLYLEADGIASGASNSIYLFSTLSDYQFRQYRDPFTGKDSQPDYPSYKFILRAGGGFGITGSFGAIMEQTNQDKNDDIYGSIAKSMKREISNLILNNQSVYALSDSTTSSGKKQALQKFRDNVIKKYLDPLQKQFNETSIKDTKDNLSSVSVSDITYNLITLYSKLVPAVELTSKESLEKTLEGGFNIKRNWIKSPLTKYNYGAGPKSIAQGLVAGNALYPGIVNAYIEKLTEYNLTPPAKRGELAKELKEITYRIMFAAAFSVTKIEDDYVVGYGTNPDTRRFLSAENFQQFNKLIQKFDSNQAIDTDFDFDPEIIRVLDQNTETLISQTMSDIITEEMYGTAFATNKDLIVGAGNLMSLIYSSLYIDRALQEVDKKNNTERNEAFSKDKDVISRVRWLTKREQAKIADELKDIAPLFSHHMNADSSEIDVDTKEMHLNSDFMSVKTGKLKDIQSRFQEIDSMQLGNSIKSASVIPEIGTKEKAGTFNTYPSGLSLKFPIDSGVLILPQAVVNMAEANIMQIMSAWKSTGLDVFDGFNMPFGQVTSLNGKRAGLGELANKAVFETWSNANLYRTIGERLDKFYRALYSEGSEKAPYAELFYSNINQPVKFITAKDGSEAFNYNQSLNDTQKIFVRSMTSIINALREAPYGAEILDKAGINKLKQIQGISLDDVAELLLPIYESSEKAIQEKNKRIKTLFLGMRLAFLKADQQIRVKQALLKGFTDFSTDQMGGAATPYIHKAEIIHYTDKKTNKDKTIEPIKSFIEYNQTKTGKYSKAPKKYETYLESLFIPKYKEAFDILMEKSKEFDFVALSKGTILEELIDKNENLADLTSKITFHDIMNQSLNEAIHSGSIQAEKEFDPEKEIKLYSMKDALIYARKKLSGTRYKKRFNVLNNLLQIFEENSSVLANYRVALPSAKFVENLIQNIDNDTIQKKLQEFFKKNNISVDYFDILKEEPNARGFVDPYTNKVISVFLNMINKQFNYDDALMTTLLHETAHAYLTEYFDNNVEFDETSAHVIQGKRNQLEQTSLEHIVDMFNVLIKEYGNPHASGSGLLEDEFDEFIVRCLTKDYDYWGLESASEYKVEADKTISSKLKGIKNLSSLLKSVTSALKKLINSLLKTNEASNIFEESRVATEILMQSADFFGTKKTKTKNKTDILYDKDITMFEDKRKLQENNFKINLIDQLYAKKEDQKYFPQEIALVHDDGSENLQINQQLHNIATLLRLNTDQMTSFTAKAKEIYTLLKENPAQLTEAISSIQEFYNQLDPNKLTDVTATSATDMQEIKDLAQTLKSSFEDLAHIDMNKSKYIKQHSFPISIPAIIALNEVSLLMQQITTQMSYSLVRTPTKDNMNQRIRDLGHNIYMILQDKGKTQNVYEQLRAIQDEAEVGSYLKWINYAPSINPYLNSIDNQFNNIMTSALDYLASSNNPVLQLLPMATYFTNEAFADIVDDLTKGIKSDILSSLLADMLPSSQYKKPFYLLRKIVKSNLDQERQDARVNKPNHIKNLFKNTYSNNEWKSLTQSVGHTDLACLSETDQQLVFDAIQNGTTDQLIQIAKDKCKDLYIALSSSEGKASGLYKYSVEPLAIYLATHKVTSPTTFNKNAYAIATSVFQGEFTNDMMKLSQKEITQQIDEAATIASFAYLSEENKQILQKVIQQDSEALHKTLNILRETKLNEEKKLNQEATVSTVSKLNAWKGYMPTTVMAGSSILIARESDKDALEKQGYKFLKYANTDGTNLNIRKTGKKTINDPLAYYFTNMPRKSMFNEGAFSIVLPSYFGTNIVTKYTIDNPQVQKVSSITDDPFIYEQLSDSSATDALAMVPVYDVNDKGDIEVISHEMVINDDSVLDKLEYQDYLPEMMGFWDGRQKEEDVATQYNLVALNLLIDKYEPSKAKDYINILDRKQLNKIQQDAVDQIPWNIRMLGSQMFKSKYSLDGIYIRKDMIRDAIGQRSASVMDVYNGITNLSPRTQNMIRKGLEIMMGKKAYQIAVGAEQAIQGLTSVARNMIVIKSIKVMGLNNFGNIWHLMAVGVPFKFIITQLPKLLKESETYAQYGFEYQKLLVERDAADSIEDKKKIQAQIDTLDTKIKSLSIAPILSEFSSINDLGMDTEDLELMRGQVASWITKQVNKLPKNMIVAGKHILMTKDTPEYQFLEKATQYGDFIAKAILYKYMTQEQHYLHDEARYRVLDEFVNYDQLAGRSRSYLENMGLLWFFNYKLRIMKVAARLLHNNPFRAMLMVYGEQWSPFGDAANVIEDSLLGKILSGEIGFTIGPGMLWRGLQMHPLLEVLS